MLFLTFNTLTILFVTMLLIFSIYSTISNFLISKAYQEASAGANSDPTTVTYKIPGAFSFGSQQIYSSEFSRTSILIQEWLGIVTLVIWNILLLWSLSIDREL